MLEPILLYRASKCKQIKKREELKLFKDLLVTLCDYHFFLCLVQHARIKLCHNRLQYIKEAQIGIIQISTKDDEYSTVCRNKLVAIITRDRVVDAGLKGQIERQMLYICERHYKEAQINPQYIIVFCSSLCKVLAS